MQTKLCGICGTTIFKKLNESQKYWDTKKIYCSQTCHGKSKIGKVATKTHGMRNSRIYNIWCLMKARCDRKNSPKYDYYGGRGISYPEKWKTFEGFFEDMQEGYNDNLSIDRIDVNGNYSKENCRWATVKEQNINKRNSHFITYNDKTQTLSEWVEETGFPHTMILARIRRGWSIEKTLSTPKI